MNGIKAGRTVLKILNEAGYEAFFVGGIVRDELLKRAIFDIDITTNATPDKVNALFEKTFATGIQHGTVTVLQDGVTVEVTTYRTEGQYLDSRRPESVMFTNSLEEDLLRRDFTINAMAKDIEGNLFDPFGGLADLKASLIKTVGHPKKRFEEDALRILRGVRFASKLGFDIETSTFAQMKARAPLVQNLSWERILKEIEGIISGKHAPSAIKRLFTADIFLNLEFFVALQKYEHRSFEAIDHIDKLLTLVALEQGNVKQFTSTLPISKIQRQMIQKVLQLRSEPQDFKINQYKYGVDVMEINHAIDCFYKQTLTEFKAEKLPIKHHKDLNIEVKDILETFDKAPGLWVQKCLQMLENGVLLGNVQNTRQQLLEFLKGQMNA